MDYGADPLAIFPRGAETRKQAALALGRLKAKYRNAKVVARLEQMFDGEQDPQVLDGAYDALLSLVSAPELETR